MAAAAVTWQTLRELAGFRSAEGCALTVYLDLDLDPSSSPTAADLETRFNSIVADVERRHLAGEEDAARKRALRADLDRVRRYWDDEFDRDGTRGLALFVSSADEFFRVLALPGSAGDHFYVNRELALAPLVGHVGRHEGALVAVLGRERGQVYRLQSGRLEEVVDESEEQPGRHDQGGWSQARYQRHIEKLVQEHLKAVGDEIDKRVRRARGPQLVVVAPEELRPEIEAALSTEAREAIVGWATAEAHSGPNELLAVVRPHLDHVLAAREQEALERWHEEIGKNARATAGWHDTLEAASDARVEQLLLADGTSHTGYRCPQCGRAAAEAGRCALDDSPLEEHDAVELAVHHTLAHGGTVLGVGGDLLGGQGVGALLRF